VLLRGGTPPVGQSKVDVEVLVSWETGGLQDVSESLGPISFSKFSKQLVGVSVADLSDPGTAVRGAYRGRFFSASDQSTICMASNILRTAVSFT
jgi:hypothetical protein